MIDDSDMKFAYLYIKPRAESMAIPTVSIKYFSAYCLASTKFTGYFMYTRSMYVAPSPTCVTTNVPMPGLPESAHAQASPG